MIHVFVILHNYDILPVILLDYQIIKPVPLDRPGVSGVSVLNNTGEHDILPL